MANLSDWPKEQVEVFRLLLKGVKLAPVDRLFKVEQSLPHGQVEVVLGTLRKIGLDEMIASKPSPERDRVVAMIVAQLLFGDSKLADTRLWHTCTLARELNVEQADEQDLYEALDWLLARQRKIERKLAGRHLREGDLVFYDVSSGYYEGRTCPLARYGHDRDEKGMLIIVYGMMANAAGCPVAVQVYPGNTGDSTTVPDQVQRLHEEFGLTRVVLVGDRGMLTETQIAQLKAFPGLGWISALRSKAIRDLLDQGALQLTLFDQCNLAEIHSPDYPGERLIACFNPDLAQDRRRTRQELLSETEKGLERIKREVARRTHKPLTEAQIAQKVGKVFQQYKMGKHYQTTLSAGVLQWSRIAASVRREEELDGIYIVRTSELSERLSADNAVRQYKNLARVEQIFRCCKGLDVLIRPIRHRAEERVRAHIFLCLLAAYVEWHMRQALAPLLFDDEEVAALRQTRDPVAPATASPSARAKKIRRVTSTGLPVHSFRTLLQAMQTRCNNRCRINSEKINQEIWQLTEPDPFQKQVIQLLGLM